MIEAVIECVAENIVEWSFDLLFKALIYLVSLPFFLVSRLFRQRELNANPQVGAAL
jgi:hypothetical protein